MSEKRFVEDESYLVNYVENHCIFDRVQGKHLYLSEVIALLNLLVDENRELRQKNKQIGYLKRDLFILLNLIKDTNLEVNYDYKKIRERWE